MNQIPCASGILYVRAALKPISREIKTAGNIVNFLKKYWVFEELIVPYFRRPRFFWEKHPSCYVSNSGALGNKIAELENAKMSFHPTHRFVGFGKRVEEILLLHDEKSSCFFPIKALAKKFDFSMLLIGCVDTSPGFSTVHVVQNELGLSQKHLIRFFVRWDIEEKGISKLAPESPGCSLSFSKFYDAYNELGIFSSGQISGVDYVFISSARLALEAERKILEQYPRFVDCQRTFCPTCRLRLY